MFDEKHAASEVGIGRHEVFECLEVVDVRGLVVRVDGPAEDAAIDSLSRAGDGGVPLRAKGRGVDEFVFGHHADILLDRSSIVEERRQQLFGLALRAGIKTTDDDGELEKGGGIVSALSPAALIDATKGHLLRRTAPHYRGLQ